MDEPVPAPTPEPPAATSSRRPRSLWIACVALWVGITALSTFGAVRGSPDDLAYRLGAVTASVLLPLLVVWIVVVVSRLVRCRAARAPTATELEEFLVGLEDASRDATGRPGRRVAFGRNGAVATRINGASILATFGQCHGYVVSSLEGSTSRLIAQQLLDAELP